MLRVNVTLMAALVLSHFRKLSVTPAHSWEPPKGYCMAQCATPLFPLVRIIPQYCITVVTTTAGLLTPFLNHMNQIHDLSRSILILSSQQCLGLPRVLLISVFPNQNPVYVPPRPFHMLHPSGFLSVDVLWTYRRCGDTFLNSNTYCPKTILVVTGGSQNSRNRIFWLVTSGGLVWISLKVTFLPDYTASHKSIFLHFDCFIPVEEDWP